MPDALTVQVPDFTAGRGKDGNWFPNVHEMERWVRQIALACADASPFTDGKEVDFIYDIYTNFVKDGRFSEVAYNSEWDRIGVQSDGDAAYMQAIDLL
eukprot:9146861-Karenia_brevis.AAC.1